MEFKECSVVINGKKASYWAAGNVNAPAVVFLHGFPGNRRGMLWLAAFFTEGHFVIMPDFPGCGQSEALVGGHGIESYGFWLDAFLGNINIDKAIIVGHSFGARVATYVAAHYPSRISATVLLTPVVRVEGFWARLATWFHGLAKLMPSHLKKRYLANTPYQYFAFWLAFKSNDIATRDEIMNQSMAEVKKLNSQIQLEVLDDLYRHDLEKWGNSIKVPCLVIAGLKDDIVTVSSIHSFVASIKNAKVEFLKDTGHLLPIEHPETTASIITKWLTGLS